MDKDGWIRACLTEAGLDAFLLKLPENVLYLTGYWPCYGWSTCLYPLDGEPILFLPAFETSFAEGCSVKDVRVLEKGDLASATVKTLKKTVLEKGFSLHRIGIEESFETISVAHVGGEIHVPTTGFFESIRKVLPNVTLVDATQILHKMRSIKGPSDVEGLKKVCEVALRGLSAALERVQEGIKECEVAAAAEAEVYGTAIGLRGIKRARAYAFVMSGPNSADAHWPFNISSERKLRRGDLVLIELNTLVDGYWSDLTRIWTCGSPSQRQKEIYEAVYGAFMGAVQSVKEGVKASHLLETSEKHLRNHGLGNYFYPFLGHGIGVGLHEPIPILTPESHDVLKAGMVHTVEPGIYIKNFGGVRIEDVVLVEEDGWKNLSQTKYALDEV